MQKANDRYDNGGSKDKTTKYYIENKEVLKENAKSNYKNMSEKEKEVKIAYGRNEHRNVTEKKQDKKTG